MSYSWKTSWRLLAVSGRRGTVGATTRPTNATRLRQSSPVWVECVTDGMDLLSLACRIPAVRQDRLQRHPEHPHRRRAGNRAIHSPTDLSTAHSPGRRHAASGCAGFAGRDGKFRRGTASGGCNTREPAELMRMSWYEGVKLTFIPTGKPVGMIEEPDLNRWFENV